VVALKVRSGDSVEKGQSLVVLEAMKMEHTIAAPGAGTVREVRVSEGAQVEAEQVLVVVTAAE
jgi:biotin carboxyl carrier protein